MASSASECICDVSFYNLNENGAPDGPGRDKGARAMFSRAWPSLPPWAELGGGARQGLFDLDTPLAQYGVKSDKWPPKCARLSSPRMPISFCSAQLRLAQVLAEGDGAAPAQPDGGLRHRRDLRLAGLPGVLLRTRHQLDLRL